MPVPLNDKERLMQKLGAKSDKTMERYLRTRLRHEFADFDCTSLLKMTKKELAEWQAKYPMNSAQYIIALQEWNRRALAEQSRWMKFSAIITAVATIIAAILGVVVGAMLSKSQQQTRLQTSISQDQKVHDDNMVVHPIEKGVKMPYLTSPLKK